MDWTGLEEGENKKLKKKKQHIAETHDFRFLPSLQRLRRGVGVLETISVHRFAPPPQFRTTCVLHNPLSQASSNPISTSHRVSGSSFTQQYTYFDGIDIRRKRPKNCIIKYLGCPV